MTSLNDTAKKIRAALKAKGWNSRDVSVRKSPGGGAIYVRVKRWDIPTCEVEVLVKGFESVSRCEATGEILSGGNTFVSVSYEMDALDSLEVLVAEVMGSGDWRKTLNVMGLDLTADPGDAKRFNVVGTYASVYDDASAPRTIARAIACSGLLVGTEAA